MWVSTGRYTWTSTERCTFTTTMLAKKTRVADNKPFCPEGDQSAGHFWLDHIQLVQLKEGGPCQQSPNECCSRVCIILTKCKLIVCVSTGTYTWISRKKCTFATTMPANKRRGPKGQQVQDTSGQTTSRWCNWKKEGVASSSRWVFPYAFQRNLTSIYVLSRNWTLTEK